MDLGSCVARVGTNKGDFNCETDENTQKSFGARLDYMHYTRAWPWGGR